MYQRTTPFEELDVDAGPSRYRDAGLDAVPGSLEALQVASGSLLGAPVQSPRELRTLLAQRGVRVLHPESLQALANLAGADCVERLIAQRVAHPLDAPDALRQRSRHPCDAGHLERLCTVLCRVPVIQLDRCEPEVRAVESVPHDMAQQLLRFVVQCPMVCVLADAQEIERSIELHHSSRDENSALVRLIEMGVPPYLVRSAVIGILAQRLVRLNCPHCRTEETVDPLVRRNLGVDERETFWHSVGCEQCHHTGFHGRQAIYELMRMNPALQSRVDDGVPADVYREIAVADGMVGLPTNGVELARSGVVSLAEVYRACM